LKLARRLDVGDRVTITHIPPDDRLGMATALAEARVFAALSDYEAHPVGIMEALSVGRPVVGYEAAGIAELISEGWVQGVSPGSSAASIGRHLAGAMYTHPLVDPAGLPTWDACAHQLGRAYRTVLTKSGEYPAEDAEISDAVSDQPELSSAPGM
jgi:glycosyltransferase involved in cell wall biosynthesis